MYGNLLTINGKAGPPMGGPAGKEISMPVLDVQAIADALLTIPQGQNLHIILRKFRACTATESHSRDKLSFSSMVFSSFI